MSVLSRRIDRLERELRPVPLRRIDVYINTSGHSLRPGAVPVDPKLIAEHKNEHGQVIQRVFAYCRQRSQKEAV